MRVRLGFVTNSSSSLFIISKELNPQYRSSRDMMPVVIDILKDCRNLTINQTIEPTYEKFNPDTNTYEVCDKNDPKAMCSGIMGVAVFQPKYMGRESTKNILDFIECCNPNDNVFDGFLGSGYCWDFERNESFYKNLFKPKKWKLIHRNYSIPPKIWKQDRNKWIKYHENKESIYKSLFMNLYKKLPTKEELEIFKANWENYSSYGFPKNPSICLCNIVDKSDYAFEEIVNSFEPLDGWSYKDMRGRVTSTLWCEECIRLGKDKDMGDCKLRLFGVSAVDQAMKGDVVVAASENEISSDKMDRLCETFNIELANKHIG